MAEDGECTIAISEATLGRIEQRLGHTEFNTVDEYAEYVLDELTLLVSEDINPGDRAAVDEQEVKERLRSMGYLRE